MLASVIPEGGTARSIDTRIFLAARMLSSVSACAPTKAPDKAASNRARRNRFLGFMVSPVVVGRELSDAGAEELLQFRRLRPVEHAGAALLPDAALVHEKRG